MKFYHNGRRIFVNSLRTLATKLRNGQPIIDDTGTNVRNNIGNSVVEQHFPKGAVVKFKVTQTPFSGVGRGKKPSGKSKKGLRKQTNYININYSIVA